MEHLEYVKCDRLSEAGGKAVKTADIAHGRRRLFIEDWMNVNRDNVLMGPFRAILKYVGSNYHQAIRDDLHDTIASTLVLDWTSLPICDRLYVCPYMIGWDPEDGEEMNFGGQDEVF